MIENILKPVKVGDLLCQKDGKPVYNFYIPAYQRGYKWEDEQVTDLMNDLYEFITTSTSKEQTYCLQPIVIKKMKNGYYEVLDGQQRLTTIFILLSRLKKNIKEIELFSLEYQIRKSSAIFLRNLDGTINKDNPDYFHISNAYDVIDKWLKEFKNKKTNIETSLFNVLAESIEFIWYEILNETDSIDIFTRINIGKIELTNAELVKAVFLSKNNLSLGIEDKELKKIIQLKQDTIALEWDEMEKTLQNTNIWGFIYGGNKEYETRIDYILDLFSNKSNSNNNKYHSFSFFYSRISEIRQNKEKIAELLNKNTLLIEDEWRKLKSIFEILLQWYYQKEYNHLIGFLINQNKDVLEIVNRFKNNDKHQFLKYIKDQIWKLLDCDDLSTLKYKKDSKRIERILLIHNIVNSLKTKDNNLLFPFDKFKNKKWTLEHIYAQNSEEIREEDYKKWVNDHLSFFSSKANDDSAIKITKKLEAILSKDKIEKESFNECVSDVSQFVQKKLEELDKLEENKEDEISELKDMYDWVNDDNSLSNLALLDGSINSSLKNSLFDIKRELVLQKDKEGSFIPHETKKVFMKYYTNSPDHLAYWTFKDRKAYIQDITQALNYFKESI